MVRNVVLDKKTKQFSEEKKKRERFGTQLTFRVDKKVGAAFWELCDDLGIKPYRLLENIVNFYGRAQIITKKIGTDEMSKDDAFIELGMILNDMKKLAQANGEFQKALKELCEPYGINLDSFRIT